MKNKRLIDAVGMIDDKMLLEAQPDEEKTHNRYVTGSVIKWVSLAACICIIAGIGVFALVLNKGEQGDFKSSHINSNSTNRESDTLWFEEKYVYLSGENEEALSTRIPKWNEMTIDEQYGSMKLDTVIELYQIDMSHEYSSNCHEIAKSELGEMIGTASVSGYDVYEEKDYSMYVPLYEIKTIAPQCAVAAELSEGRYYVYINPYYKPQTLEQFITDLSLKENISFGGASIRYNDADTNNPETIVFEESISVDEVWNILMTDTDITAVDDYDSQIFVATITLSVNIEKLGYENISLGMTQDDFLITNILASGKGFKLRDSADEALFSLLVNNYKGYKLVYVEPDELSDSENDDNSSVVSTIVSNAEPIE